MAEHGGTGELYTGNLISMLEVIWGEGWLSPGGPEEVSRVFKGEHCPTHLRARKPEFKQ